MANLTHLDGAGRPHMVDVGIKPLSLRTARARGKIVLAPATLALISQGTMPKGNVLTVAELAGVQAAKRTSELIPLCHPIALTQIDVQATLLADGIEVTAQVRCVDRTGVEMEALTAVSVALLTIYDMCKAVDQAMQVVLIALEEKTKVDI